MNFYKIKYLGTWGILGMTKSIRSAVELKIGMSFKLDESKDWYRITGYVNSRGNLLCYLDNDAFVITESVDPNTYFHSFDGQPIKVPSVVEVRYSTRSSSDPRFRITIINGEALYNQDGRLYHATNWRTADGRTMWYSISVNSPIAAEHGYKTIPPPKDWNV